MCLLYFLQYTYKVSIQHVLIINIRLLQKKKLFFDNGELFVFRLRLRAVLLESTAFYAYLLKATTMSLVSLFCQRFQTDPSLKGQHMEEEHMNLYSKKVSKVHTTTKFSGQIKFLRHERLNPESIQLMHILELIFWVFWIFFLRNMNRLCTNLYHIQTKTACFRLSSWQSIVQ